MELALTSAYKKNFNSKNNVKVLFDRDTMAIYYKKIHTIPYKSISTSAINFMPGKVEILFSLDSGYQIHLNFISMNHDKKENLKKVYNVMIYATL